MSENTDDNIYLCFYCGKSVKLNELLKVDSEMEELDSEIQEFVSDQLPKSNKPRKVPYVHKDVELEHDVLNICKKCFNKAHEKVYAENEDAFITIPSNEPQLMSPEEIEGNMDTYNEEIRYFSKQIKEIKGNMKNIKDKAKIKQSQEQIKHYEDIIKRDQEELDELEGKPSIITKPQLQTISSQEVVEQEIDSYNDEIQYFKNQVKRNNDILKNLKKLSKSKAKVEKYQEQNKRYEDIIKRYKKELDELEGTAEISLFIKDLQMTKEDLIESLKEEGYSDKEIKEFIKSGNYEEYLEENKPEPVPAMIGKKQPQLIESKLNETFTEKEIQEGIEKIKKWWKILDDLSDEIHDDKIADYLGNEGYFNMEGTMDSIDEAKSEIRELRRIIIKNNPQFMSDSEKEAKKKWEEIEKANKEYHDKETKIRKDLHYDLDTFKENNPIIMEYERKQVSYFDLMILDIFCPYKVYNNNFINYKFLAMIENRVKDKELLKTLGWKIDIIDEKLVIIDFIDKIIAHLNSPLIKDIQITKNRIKQRNLNNQERQNFNENMSGDIYENGFILFNTISQLEVYYRLNLKDILSKFEKDKYKISSHPLEYNILVDCEDKIIKTLSEIKEDLLNETEDYKKIVLDKAYRRREKNYGTRSKGYKLMESIGENQIQFRSNSIKNDSIPNIIFESIMEYEFFNGYFDEEELKKEGWKIDLKSKPFVMNKKLKILASVDSPLIEEIRKDSPVKVEEKVPVSSGKNAQCILKKKEDKCDFKKDFKIISKKEALSLFEKGKAVFALDDRDCSDFKIESKKQIDEWDYQFGIEVKSSKKENQYVTYESEEKVSLDELNEVDKWIEDLPEKINEEFSDNFVDARGNENEFHDGAVNVSKNQFIRIFKEITEDFEEESEEEIEEITEEKEEFLKKHPEVAELLNPTKKSTKKTTKKSTKK